MKLVTITNSLSGMSIEIPITSKKTILTGKGATGKSFLFDLLTANDESKEFSMQYSAGELKYLNDKNDLRQDDTTLLVSDESYLNGHKGVINSILKLPNPILVICRNASLIGETDVRSVLYLEFDGSTPIISTLCSDKIISLPVGRYTHYICESNDGKSEHLVLDKLLSLDPLVAAGGNNKIPTKVRNIARSNKNHKILIFADLASFSTAALFLEERVPYANYQLYDYQCFESLLIFSKLTQSLSTARQYNYTLNVSEEHYCEKLLEEITKGTKLEYKHRPSSVSECFYTECEECSDYADSYTLRVGSKHNKGCIYSDPNVVGKVLFNKYGIGLMAWYYANYTQFLETYNYLIEDKSKIPEEQALDILNSIKDTYLGDLRYKCFDD